jgi:hypothetical protein
MENDDMQKNNARKYNVRFIIYFCFLIVCMFFLFLLYIANIRKNLYNCKCETFFFRQAPPAGEAAGGGVGEGVSGG